MKSVQNLMTDLGLHTTKIRISAELLRFLLLQSLDIHSFFVALWNICNVGLRISLYFRPSRRVALFISFSLNSFYMEHETLARALQLLEILAEGQYLSVAQMVERSRLHPRGVYRLLKVYPSMGLTLERKGHTYRLAADAPLVKRITSYLHFTPDEVLTLRQILTAVPNNSVQARLLREKLERSTSEGVFIPPGVDEVTGRNIRTMFEAIEQERIVVLRGYTSSRSQKSNRFVEPYAFLPGNRDVRCFEISSKTNKTFNLSRAESVEIVDLKWSFRNEHRPLVVDLFHFSGETTTTVKLRLGVLAKSVLLDEYPQAETHLEQEDETHWLWEDEYCSMKGIGRFVMGLLEDVEIVDAPELEAYIAEQIRQASRRFSLPPATL